MRKELHKVLSDNVKSVNKRVYPLIMPQDMKENSIVYTVMSTIDQVGVNCPTPYDTDYMVQLDLFAKTYAQSVDLLNKVKEVLRANFVVNDLTSFELYENITVKYRQVIDVRLSLRIKV